MNNKKNAMNNKKIILTYDQVRCLLDPYAFLQYSWSMVTIEIQISETGMCFVCRDFCTDEIKNINGTLEGLNKYFMELSVRKQ